MNLKHRWKVLAAVIDGQLKSTRRDTSDLLATPSCWLKPQWQDVNDSLSVWNWIVLFPDLHSLFFISFFQPFSFVLLPSLPLFFEILYSLYFRFFSFFLFFTITLLHSTVLYSAKPCKAVKNFRNRIAASAPSASAMIRLCSKIGAMIHMAQTLSTTRDSVGWNLWDSLTFCINSNWKRDSLTHCWQINNSNMSISILLLLPSMLGIRWIRMVKRRRSCQNLDNLDYLGSFRKTCPFDGSSQTTLRAL